MKKRILFAIASLLMMSLAAGAQDLKPVKDRDSKKFGYQDKSKNWVIAPSFDKAKRFIDGYAIVEVQGLEGLINATGGWVLRPDYNSIGKFDKLGFCELMVKDGRNKFYGLADRSGNIIIPTECSSVTVSRSEELIYARRPSESGKSLWGVYNLAGEELFAPQFSSSPTFRGGVGTACSGETGLWGLIGRDGTIILPFENLAISDGPGAREVLTTDFSIISYDARMNKTDELRSPGAVKPYDTFGDDVRTAAWHCGVLGTRLHSNNVRLATITRTTAGRSASMSPLQVDWSYGRFMRLEPEATQVELPGSMEHPYNGKLYTLRAIMYEADGSYAGIASDYGWLEGRFPEGWIYNSEGKERWIIFDDPNYPARQRNSGINLDDYGQIDGSDVISGLCLDSYDLKRLQDPERFMERQQEIIEGENVGITSYLPHPEPRSREDVRLLREAMQAPIFQRAWYIGDAVSCEVSRRGEEYRVTLADRLVCHFRDSFSNPSFSMEGEEEIFWGPNNARFIALDLEIAGSYSSDLTVDDVYGSNHKFNILVDMYEEDGSFLRTLATVPAIDFINDGIIVFEKPGIALITRGRGTAGHIKPEFVIPAASRLAPALSAIVNSDGQNAVNPDSARQPVQTGSGRQPIQPGTGHKRQAPAAGMQQSAAPMRGGQQRTAPGR